MVDFWEVYGRMLADNTFRSGLMKVCPGQPYSIGTQVPSLGNKGLMIDKQLYADARQVISSVVKGPVSLLAVGEVLMSASTDRFRASIEILAAAIQRTVQTGGHSRLFYVGLGCMMLDGQVLADFSLGVFDDLQFDALSTGERNALRTLANTNSVVMASGDVCMLYWDIACFDKYAFYTSSGADHMHPIVAPYPPVTSTYLTKWLALHA